MVLPVHQHLVSCSNSKTIPNALQTRPTRRFTSLNLKISREHSRDLASTSAFNSSADAMIRHYSMVIVGGGQAGLSMSYCLNRRGIDHLVVEKCRHIHLADAALGHVLSGDSERAVCAAGLSVSRR